MNRKRKHNDITQTLSKAANETSEIKSGYTKYKLEEGFSWWTCLQYDMSLEKTKPQPKPSHGTDRNFTSEL